MTYRMSTQEEPRHGGKPNLVLGNNLAGTAISRGKRTTDKRSTASSCRGKPLKKQEPELDDDNNNDDDGDYDDNDDDDGEVFTVVMRKLNHSEVKGIGPVYTAGRRQNLNLNLRTLAPKPLLLTPKQ